jgi:hypothetical protein
VTDETICDWCGGGFDESNDGHVDETTGLAFCGAPCEMHYDQEIGLPDEYEQAP